MSKFKLIMENWRGYLEKERVDEVLPAFSSKAKMKRALDDETAEEGPEERPDQQREIKTIGDLKKILQAIRIRAAGGQGAMKAAEFLTLFFPPAGVALKLAVDAVDAAGLVKKLYGAEDNFKTASGLDALNVDDKVSAIVDNPIEDAFMKNLLKKIKDLPDNTPVSAAAGEGAAGWNVTKELQKYLATKFDDVTVKK